MKTRTYTTTISQLALFFVTGSMMLTGCAKNAIRFVEGTNLAIDANASADANDPISFSVGYKRQVLSVIPKKCVPNCNDETEAGNEEALSVISVFSVDTDRSGVNPPGPNWPRDLIIRNHFATGAAAKTLSNNTTPQPRATFSRDADTSAGEPTIPGDASIEALMTPF